MKQHIRSKTVGKCLNGLLAKNSTQKMVYVPRFSEKGKRNKLKSSKNQNIASPCVQMFDMFIL